MDTKPQSDAATTAAQATADKPRRIIKRYSNRKLYDTKDSRYVTLLQIAEMVRTGEEVQIIDNNTKEDLTEVTLAQIIYEEQKQKASSRSVPLQTLKELIHQCLCRLDPEYAQDPDWQQGFSVVHVEDNGFYHVQQIPILKQSMFFYGREKISL